jgi:hypothetical protein
MVDTGNGSFPLIVGPRAAESLGIDASKFDLHAGYAVDIDATAKSGRIDRFEVAGIRVDHPIIAVSPALDQISERAGRGKVIGNLGYPFLKDYTLTFDFVNSKMSLSNAPAVGELVPFEVEKEKPLMLIDVFVNGKPFRFALDTGAGQVCISTSAATKLGLKKLAEVNMNMGGKEKGFFSTLDSMQIGNREQKNVSVVAAGFLSDLSKKVGATVDGIIGYNFWSHYKLVIDYPHKRLLLADPPPLDK